MLWECSMYSCVVVVVVVVVVLVHSSLQTPDVLMCITHTRCRLVMLHGPWICSRAIWAVREVFLLSVKSLLCTALCHTFLTRPLMLPSLICSRWIWLVYHVLVAVNTESLLSPSLSPSFALPFILNVLSRNPGPVNWRNDCNSFWLQCFHCLRAHLWSQDLHKSIYK